MILVPDEEPLREFNSCHDPDSGRFCSGRGWDVQVSDEVESAVTDRWRAERRQRDAAPYTPPDTSRHKIVRDGGLWGYSHRNSSAMSAYAAGLMGIGPGDDALGAPAKRAVERFLSAIAESPGSEEMLFHGFQNTRGTHYKVGDTVRLPLTATAGSREVASYATRLDRADQTHAPMLLEFPKGTPMVAYGKWSGEERREFRHVYSEALVAGEFRVVSTRQERLYQPQHDSRPGTKGHHSTTLYRVVRLAPLRVFDPATKTWRKVPA